MEIKPCPSCGSEAQIERRDFPTFIEEFVQCSDCCARSMGNTTVENEIDAWNSRVEPNPSEADRWLNEATEQRARAELAEMQRDELSEALEQARRMLAYSGKLQ